MARGTSAMCSTPSVGRLPVGSWSGHYCVLHWSYPPTPAARTDGRSLISSRPDSPPPPRGWACGRACGLVWAGVGWRPTLPPRALRQRPPIRPCCGDETGVVAPSYGACVLCALCCRGPRGEREVGRLVVCDEAGYVGGGMPAVTCYPREYGRGWRHKGYIPSHGGQS